MSFFLSKKVDDTQNSECTTSIHHYNSYSDSSLFKNGPKSNLNISGNKKLSKKRVVWADSCAKQLENVQYFYLDESERGLEFFKIFHYLIFEKTYKIFLCKK